MSTKKLRDERYELYKKSRLLQETSKEEKVPQKRTFELNKMQNEIYKKWNFYDKFIKAVEKNK